MDYVTTALVFTLSLTAVPITWFLNKQIEWHKDARITYPTFFLCWALASAVPIWFLRKRYRNIDCIVYVFSALCWSSLLNLCIALDVDGFVKGFLGKQLVNLEWEPVFNTSQGVLLLYWDGTVHYILQLSAVVLYTVQDSYREVGLYWCGSLLNSMLVLVYGYLIGSGGTPRLTQLNSSPLILISLAAAFNLIRDRPIQARSFRRVPPVFRRPVDLFFLIFFILALVLAIFRGLTALGAEVSCMRDYLIHFEPYISDPSGFPKIQMVINMFYSVFYYVCVIDALINFGGQLWLADWSLIHAGAAAQSQFTYMASSIHPMTARNFRPPKAGMGAAVFWGFNLLLLIIPHLFAWRCWRDPDNCGRTYTTDLARPAAQYGLSTRLSNKKTQKKE